jgi:hypothetical protein
MITTNLSPILSFKQKQTTTFARFFKLFISPLHLSTILITTTTILFINLYL